MTLKFTLILLLATSLSFSQRGRREANPVFREISNKAVVQSVYPEAVKVEKVNDFWYQVLDKNNRVIGFALSSVPHCSDIIGYNGTTPVLIITNTKGIIQKVGLLSHYETMSYVRILESCGFFDLWTNKALKNAKQVTLDGYSGATQTALAIERNIHFLIDHGINQMPKRK